MTSRRRSRAAKELRAGRAIVAFDFERLWRPAPYLPWRPDESDLDRANRTAAAKVTALAWLAHMIGGPQWSDIEDCADIEVLRKAYLAISRASIADVRRWADQYEAEACAAA